MKKNFVLWIVFLVLLLALSDLSGTGSSKKNEVIFSDFLTKVESGDVQSVEIRGKNISGKLKTGEDFSTLSTEYPDLIKELKGGSVDVKVIPLISKGGQAFAIIMNWLPFVLLIGLALFMLKGASGGSSGAFKFAKSRAKLLQMKGKVTFKDVAGIDEAKEELKELVDFLKEPEKYTKIGARIPRGCLLIGEPGTGKTLLARAIAGEAEVPFFFISGSDFVEMFVGVGASRVRDMFEEAKKNAPCLVFIDEIDAVGRHRGIGIGGGNDEREQTLNQLLVEMDGFEGNEGVIVIAATNRADVLDKALTRPGRFDRQITVSLPDYKGRQEILEVHAKKVHLSSDVDLSVMAKATPGFSGADLANLINESALLTARADRKRITMEEMEEALDKITIGLTKKNKIMSDFERKITAYHEAGHAVVALNSKSIDPIHKITIISRGGTGGATHFLPEDDRNYNTKIEILERIRVSLGGRSAEELMFGSDKITGGASGDIKHATRLAEVMVTVYGFSDKLGMVNYEKKRSNSESYQLEGSSDSTLELIDSEIKKIIEDQKKMSDKILKEHKGDLVKIAEALLIHETLDKEQVMKVLAGEKLEKNNGKADYKNTSFSIFNVDSINISDKKNEKDEIIFDDDKKTDGKNDQQKKIKKPKEENIKKTNVKKSEKKSTGGLIDEMEKDDSEK